MDEIKITKMEKDIEYIKEKQDSQALKIDDVHRFIFQGELDNKYAPRHTLEIVYAMIGTLLLILLGFFVWSVKNLIN